MRDIASGGSHACALAPNGAAYCWGRNDAGELGNGGLPTIDSGYIHGISRAPTLVVGGFRFSQLSTQYDITCGIGASDAAIYCWGFDHPGDATDSAVTAYCGGKRECRVTLPLRIRPESLPGDRERPNDVKFTRVGAGMRMACAVSVSGEAYCWGSNYRCELGRCRSGESYRAHRLAVPGRVVEVAAGYWHACARTADLRIFCWGDNTKGQLGSLATANAGRDGRPPNYLYESSANAAYEDLCFNGGRCSPAPVEVVSAHRWGALAMGTDHACALAEDDGGIYCWGGTDSTVFSGGATFVDCENRSAQWKDTRCQPSPVRIPGLPPLAAPRAQSSAVAPSRDDSASTPNEVSPARVFVSRRELRVEFARDTTGLWGWSEREDPNYVAHYDWSVLIPSMDGPRLLTLRVGRDSTEAREFTSLDSLIAVEKPVLCAASDSGGCATTGVTASARDSRVVLTVRSAKEIARLFGMRPPTVNVITNRPEGPFDYVGEQVKVRYISPQIPKPNAATRADAARSQAAFDKAIRSVSRSIGRGHWDWSPLWLVIGDSAGLSVIEMHCIYDTCSEQGFDGDVTWAVDDTSIVQFNRLTQRLFSPAGRDRILVRAGRRGRTVVRAALAPWSSDSLPSSRPPSRNLEREVHVMPPVDHVTLTVPSDTIRANDAAEFRARAFDGAGQVIAGAPVSAKLLSNSVVTSANADGQLWITFESPGLHTIAVSFSGKVDTVSVKVQPPRKR